MIPEYICYDVPKIMSPGDIFRLMPQIEIVQVLIKQGVLINMGVRKKLQNYERRGLEYEK